MDYFRNSELLELYGSTEQGWATLLRPSEQMTKLGSVGREFTGTGRIRLLDENGGEVPDGEIGELYTEKWGEAVHAVIVLRDGEAASADELAQWCTGKLAGYKRPKSFSFVAGADMPRTATGKILHRVLKSRLSGS